MHKRAEDPARDANKCGDRRLERPAFTISRLARAAQSGKTKIASFTLEVEGIASIACDVFQGEPIHVRPAAVCDQRSGLWLRKVKLDPELLEAVTEAVVARLEADSVSESA